jgi:triosephosphate isomerase
MNRNSMRRPIIAANWKLHKTIVEARQFVERLCHHCPDPGEMDVILAAPFTALAAMHDSMRATPYLLAAQDVFWEEQGAYTGAVSAPLLVDAGCSYVIIGHSERRQYFAETDETVGKKVAAALRSGLHSIVCVGESLAQRQAGETFAVVARQIRQGLATCDTAAMTRLVLAYEPIWAIGTGVTATPAQAQEVHRHIRGVLSQVWGADVAQAMRLQYGGSVNPHNIAALMAEEDIDGALVGGASLDVETFAHLVGYRRREV